MLSAERLARILERIHAHGTGTVADLAADLGVTEQTIRRDLSRLEADGKVVRSHGGATLAPGLAVESAFASRLGEAAEQKRLIAAAAVELVMPGDRVLIDAGTTTLAVARALPERFGLKVITNAVPVAAELALRQGIDVVLVGGEVRGSTLSTVGAMASEAIRRLHAHKLFLAAGGLHPERGLTNSNLVEAEVKQAMIAAADQVCVVAHGAKLGKVLLYSFAPVSAIHTLITTEEAPPDLLNVLRQKGIRIIIAKQ